MGWKWFLRVSKDNTDIYFFSTGAKQVKTGSSFLKLWVLACYIWLCKYICKQQVSGSRLRFTNSCINVPTLTSPWYSTIPYLLSICKIETVIVREKICSENSSASELTLRGMSRPVMIMTLWIYFWNWHNSSEKLKLPTVLKIPIDVPVARDISNWASATLWPCLLLSKIHLQLVIDFISCLKFLYWVEGDIVLFSWFFDWNVESGWAFGCSLVYVCTHAIQFLTSFI